MKKAIIYGWGKNARNWFANNMAFCMWIYQDYEIIGIVDADTNLQGSIVALKGQKRVLSLDELYGIEFDSIIITPSKFYDEIKDKLINEFEIGIEKIDFLHELISQFFDEQYRFELANGDGIEIGGPSYIFSGIYSRCSSCDGVNFSKSTVWGDNDKADYLYKDVNLGRQIILDAVSLESIRNEQYDFYISSNNLEHIANPMKALAEGYRILKKSGTMIIVVPNKFYTFDHDREFTSFEHILSDYVNDINENDLTHLPEIVEKHDYKMDADCNGKEAFVKRAENNYLNRCLHHHVFSKECLKAMYEYFGMSIVFIGEYNSDYIIVGRK